MLDPCQLDKMHFLFVLSIWEMNEQTRKLNIFKIKNHKKEEEEEKNDEMAKGEFLFLIRRNSSVI